MNKDKYVKICPKCKSPDVDVDKSDYLQPAIGLPATYVCNKCGNRGYVFPEIKLSDLEEFHEELEKENISPKKKMTKEEPLVNTHYENFLVGFYWKIISPIILLAGIIMLIKRAILPGAIIILMSLFVIYFSYFKRKAKKQNMN